MSKIIFEIYILSAVKITFNEILEKEIQTTDYHWYQMNILPYFVGNTIKTNGVIITFVEITARIQDLRNYENLVTEYETLLATISHDVKNPTTSILLTINQLKKESGNQSNVFGDYSEYWKIPS
ncbi:hypothetical protein [Mucilaginibacter sp. KACC 22063]|uniref:hypothetical protein n=1 Tax=Mucilaginibacter sp. KACC 22063 TaxID=3025666 RepID=UPI002365851D|nr:hypothetical protein [Mucilaginibacter sp. KACC 22063]WDF57246.1 hypothetical protein PQ461_09295 [Mucilaginibacter sp. KACC 22063]